MKTRQNPLIPFDWETWFNFLDQFGEVRDHLVRAGREFILALKALVGHMIVNLEADYPDMRPKWEFLYALQYGLGFLGARLDSVGVSDVQQTNAKKSALKSIIHVIDAEIQSVRGQQLESERSDEDRIKLGAFAAIRNVLQRELDKISKNAASGGAKKNPGTKRKSRG